MVNLRGESAWTGLLGHVSACALLAAFAVVGAPGQTFAQDDAAAVVDDEEDDTERMVVTTARKREENVQDVPISISAIPPAQLENQAAQDIEDLEGLIPSLVIDPVGAGPQGGAFAIRGVSFEDIEKSFDPAVGVLIDGVYIGTNTGQLLDFFDLQGVEVLRGPQGTLFGRNTTGGVINLTRTRPTGEWGVNAAINYASYGRNDYKLVVNAPVAGEKLKAKSFLFYQTSDGFYGNRTKNDSDGKIAFLNYGVTLESQLTDDLNILVTFEKMEDDGETAVSPLSQTGLDLICLAPGAPGFAPANECNRSVDDLDTQFSQGPGNIDYNVTAITAQVNYDIGEFTLTSITGFRDSQEDVFEDFDATSIDFFETRRRQDYQQFSQEFRIAGPVRDWVYVVAGVYYWDTEYQLLQDTFFGAVLGGGAPFNLNQTTDHETTSVAGFVEANIDLAPDWRLTLGGRYTSEEKSITRGNNIGPFQLFEVSDEEDWGEFTYRAIIDHKITDDHLIYASVARGFRSGGFNGRANSPTSLGPFDPEFINAYEIGAKTSWFDQMLLLNAAFFYNDYSDKQEDTVQPSPPGSANPQETVVTNAADATIWGIELEFTAMPTEKLTFRGAFSYLNAEYDEFLVDVDGDFIPEDISSRNLRRAPEFTFSIGADYRTPLLDGELLLSTSFRFVDEYETTIVGAPDNPFINDPRGTTETLEFLSASASYFQPFAGGELRFTIFGRNILDDRGISSVLPVAGLFTFGAARPPSEVGAEIGFKF